MFRKFGTVNFVFVAERVSVPVEAIFVCVLRKNDVICAVFGSTIDHVCTVNQAFCEAISSEGTGLINFAVAHKHIHAYIYIYIYTKGEGGEVLRP